MAKTINAQKPAPQTESRGRGRPPANPDADPKQTAIEHLQASANRACLTLMDRATGTVAAHAARCARAGVPRATVAKAMEGIRSALDDLDNAIDRAYSAPTARPVVAQRVNLLE